MPTSSNLVLFCFAATILILTPGPNFLFFLSFLPQFVNPPAEHVARQLFVLGSIYMLLTLLVYGLVGYFAGSVGRWLRTREDPARRLRRIAATSFIGLGVWAALPERR